MASRTRSAIKTLVESHTGASKSDLENSLCDNALKVALLQHPFKDAQSEPTDFAITESNSYSTISATTGIINIISARIVETSSTRSTLLKLKTRTWWDSHIIDPDDNSKGWPKYGMRWGSKILLDCPAESGLSLRLRATREQTFTHDTNVCPIAVLDIFVEHYVTANVFKSLEQWDSADKWMQSACGVKWLLTGEPGGELLKAIQADTVMDLALDMQAEPAERGGGNGGVAVENLITDHDDYGSTRWWH